MEISRDKVMTVVVAALNEAQEDLAVDAIEIGEKTTPVGDLEYFDSLASVMVTVRCLDALGCEDEPDNPTLFIDKEGKCLTVGEVVDNILELLNGK